MERDFLSHVDRYVQTGRLKNAETLFLIYLRTLKHVFNSTYRLYATCFILFLSTALKAQTGAALSFDGVDDYVVLPATVGAGITSLNTNQAFTIEYWFKGSSLQSAVRFQSYSSGQYIIAGWNGKHIISVDGGTNGISVGNMVTITNGNWHHIALVWQKNTVNGFRSYLDGELVEQRDAANVTLPNLGGSTNSTLGCYYTSNNTLDEFTNGSLDEVRIWNVALNDCDIKRNFRCERTLPQTGLVAYYKFNQGTGSGTNTGVTILDDVSSNNLDGALNGFALSGSSSNWISSGGLTSGVSCTGTLTPSVSITASNQNVLIGSPVTFTATPTLGGLTPQYQWKKNGNNIGSNASTYTANNLSNGDVISVVMTSSEPCVTTSTATSNNITMAVVCNTITASTSPSSLTSISSSFSSVGAVGLAFTDIDNDGLQDLILGSAAGTMSHFEQSTPNSTTFNLVTNNFNGIDVGSYAIPTVTDLDGDLLLDLLVGNQSGLIAHYEQASHTSSTFNLVTNSYNSIDVGSNAAPTVVDIDKDGLLDLLIGNNSGTFFHYEQTATNSTSVGLVSDNFNGIDVGFRSIPCFTDLDNDGLLDLLASNGTGYFDHYEQASTNSLTFNLVTTKFQNLIGLGAYAAGVFKDIDNDGLLNFFFVQNGGFASASIGHIGQTVGSFNVFKSIANQPSSTQTVQVWGGTCLTSDVTVTASSHFEISLSPNSGFSNSVVLTQTNGVLANTIVYVRFNSSVIGSRSGNLQISSVGSNTISYNLTGINQAPCSPKLMTSLNPSVLSGVTTLFNSINTSSAAVPSVADVDGDGLMELFVGKGDGQMNRYEQASANSTTFNFVSGNFNAIDVGQSSSPAFTDIDNDGLFDVVIGNSLGGLSHYEQATLGGGTFNLVTSNFNNISVGANAALRFAYIDNDDLLDMLVGGSDGTLSYYEQESLNSTVFNLVSTGFSGINVGSNSVPALTDLDSDGLLDLIVGRGDGQMSHYEQASSYSLSFNLVKESFSFIDVGDNAAPVFLDMDNDGYLDLLVGTSSGTINYYRQVQGSFKKFDLEPVNIKQSFQVWGETCLTSPITITAPTGFEVSLSQNTGFTSSLSITPSDGKLAANLIYVRFSPPTCSSFSGNLNISSPDVASKTYTLMGSSDFTVPAQTANNALNFDGVDDYVRLSTINYNGTCSTTPISVPLTNAITIEYWFRGSNIQSAVRFQTTGESTFIVAGWKSPSGAFKHLLTYTEDNGNFWSRDEIEVGTAATDGNWHHIAMTWQSGNIADGFKSYLDGQLIEQRQTTSTGSLPSITGLYLGSFEGTSEFMNGSLDEVRVWNVARTQAEIQVNLYNSINTPQSGLLMYYKFDHGIANGNNSSIIKLLNSANSTLYSGTLNGFTLNGSSSNWVNPRTSIHYVKQGGTGNGTSWADASGDLQAMINTSVDGDQVWVAAGTYKPTPNSDRTIAFSMKAGVKVYGGFNGTEIILSQRDWNVNKTILSGDLNGDDVISGSGATLNIANNADNSYHVILNNSNDINALSTFLDGFTITGGNANGSFPNERGGGMYNNQSSPRLYNIIFTGNYANFGGGIFNENASPNLNSVIISKNKANNGAGIYNSNGASPSLVNVTFSGNYGSSSGGGMRNTSSSPSLTNVIFSKNHAGSFGGGLYNESSSNLNIINTTFTGNSSGNGGTIYSSTLSTASIKNSIFWDNSASTGSDISNNGGTITLNYTLLQLQESSYVTGFSLGAGMLYRVDPLFVNAVNEDYRLQSQSCAVDAGNNADVPTGITTDLAGNLRIYNGGIVDMGVFETQSVKQPFTPPAQTNDNALNFDGIDDYVRLSTSDFSNCTSAPLNFSDAITIEYWFKGTNIQSAVRFQNGSDYISAGWGSSGSFKHILSNSGGTNGISVGATATDGNWHHIAMTWQKGVTNGFKSYLDGQLVEQKDAANVSLPSFNSGMYLGAFNGTAEFTQGTLNEVRVWNVARTQAQIQSNLCGTITTPQSGLLMYYKFDHGIVNGNNATSTQLLNSANESVYTGTLNNFSLTGSSSNWVQSLETIRYVRQGGTGNGTSWANASGDLQAMINFCNVEQVWVAAGTYKPTSSTDRTISFSMKEGVKIYGGFPATGNPTFSDRNWNVHKSILSGDLNGDDLVTGSGSTLSITNNSENSYHVIFNDNNGLTTSNALLDGFTITGGNANGSNTITSYGGGMLNRNTDPSLVNVVFSANRASVGGGIANLSHSSPNLTDITFSRNIAVFNGGGIYNELFSAPTIKNCILSNNRATEGGGILNYDYSSPSLVNVTLFGNYASGSGGAMQNQSNSSPSLTNVTFFGNNAVNNGGGIYNRTSSAQPSIKNSIFWNNTSANGADIVGSITNISYSLLQSGQSSYTSGFNFGQGMLFGMNPLFVDAANGDLSLQSQSPAIDAGNNDGVVFSITTDLAGNPRISNNCMVDMGAYEFQSAGQPLPVLTTSNALNFDGTNDFVSLSTIDFTNCGTAPLNLSSAITIEYWFKGSNIQSAVRFQNGSDYISAGWGTAGSFKHILSNSGGTDGVSVGAAATDGNWHHVAMTWQKGEINGFRSYLDGQLVEAKNADYYDLPSFSSGMFLGSFNGTDEFMNGSLDEVRVWNVARTQQQLQDNMCSELTLSQTGLLMYYKFNHGTSNASNTSSTQLLNSANPNLYLGTLNNFTLNGTSSNWVNPKDGCKPVIALKIFLEGAYDLSTHKMRDDLRVANYLPTTEPFTALNNINLAHKNGGGLETIAPSVLTVTGDNAIVDWVLIELRDPTNAANVLYTRSALVQKDGGVVDLDGVSPVVFNNASIGSYFIGVKHRNHLRIRTQNTVSLSASITDLNLTNNSVSLVGSNPLILLETIATVPVYAMYSGDLNANGSIDATDRSDAWNSRNLTGYNINDCSLNGTVDATDRSNTWNNRNITTSFQ